MRLGIMQNENTESFMALRKKKYIYIYIRKLTFICRYVEFERKGNSYENDFIYPIYNLLRQKVGKQWHLD